MSLSYPSRRGGSSLTLVVTFFLGVLIGAVLFYAIADARGWDFSATASKIPVSAAPEPELAPEPVAEDTPETLPAEPQPAEPTPEEPPAEPTPPPAPPDVPDADIAKHFMVDIQGAELDDAAREALAAFKPGLVVLRAQNLPNKEQGQKLIADIKAAVGDEGLGGWPLIAVSQEGGDDNPLKVKDAPTAKAIAGEPDNSKASARARAAGVAYAAEAREWGVGLLLAPRLDIFDPKVSDPALEARSFGSDPERAADLANSMHLGMYEAGAVAVGKHFPGLGQAVHGENGVLSIPLSEIRYLVDTMFPFSEAAATGIRALLVAHVSVPGLDPGENPPPAPLSKTLLQQVLRDQFKFNGLIIADDISSSPFTSGRPTGEVVVDAMAAGSDIVYLGALDPERLGQAIGAVKDGLASGTVNAESLASGLGRLEQLRTYLQQPPLVTPAKPKAKLPAQPEGTEKLLHRVSRNETLDMIAKKYGVSAEDIKMWNALTEDKVTFAQRLNVYVSKEKPKEKEVEKPKAEETKPAEAKEEESKPEETKTEPEQDTESAETPVEVPSEAKPDDTAPGETPVKMETTETPENVPAPADDAASKEDEPKGEEPKAEEPKAEEAKAEEKKEEATAKDNVPVQYHKVVAGDTLRKIASKYNSTPSALMKLNKLTSPDQILLGTKLKVPKQP